MNDIFIKERVNQAIILAMLMIAAAEVEAIIIYLL